MKRNAGFQDLRDLRVRAPRPLVEEARHCSMNTDQDVKRRRPSTDDQAKVRTDFGRSPHDFGQRIILSPSFSFDTVWAFPLALDANNDDTADAHSAPLTHRPSAYDAPPSPWSALLHMFDGWALDGARPPSSRVTVSRPASEDENDYSIYSEEGHDGGGVGPSRHPGSSPVSIFGSPNGFNCPPLLAAADFRAATAAPLWRGVPIHL